MLRLALQLLGTRGLQGEWRKLCAFGAGILATGLVILDDASDGETRLVLEAFGWVLVAIGVVQLAHTHRSRDAGYSIFNRISGTAAIVIGLCVVDFPIQVDVAVPVLFGVALIANGAFQIVSAWMIRFPGWHSMAISGGITAAVGALCFLEWHEAERWAVPLFLGFTLTLWGGTTIATGLRFRSLDRAADTSDAGARMIAHFLDHLAPRRYVRGLAGTRPLDQAIREASRAIVEDTRGFVSRGSTPLAVHVWTPAGSMEAPGEAQTPIVARYIAAVDASGNVSSGHAALELPPALYVSHYPMEELSVQAEGHAVALDLRAQDREGKFLPGHAYEVASWMPPSVTIRFTRFHEANLRRFWELYRTDTTYNLTNRNCSVAVALSLDVALAGALETESPVLTLLRLLVDADCWGAAFIRRKAIEMVWTPGLVMDYAYALRNVLEKHRAA